MNPDVDFDFDSPEHREKIERVTTSFRRLKDQIGKTNISFEAASAKLSDYVSSEHTWPVHEGSYEFYSMPVVTDMSVLRRTAYVINPQATTFEMDMKLSEYGIGYFKYLLGEAEAPPQQERRANYEDAVIHGLPYGSVIEPED